MNACHQTPLHLSVKEAGCCADPLNARNKVLDARTSGAVHMSLMSGPHNSTISLANILNNGDQLELKTIQVAE